MDRNCLKRLFGKKSWIFVATGLMIFEEPLLLLIAMTNLQLSYRNTLIICLTCIVENYL